MSAPTSLDYFIPLGVSIVFYAAIFGLTEGCRRLVDRFISPKRNIHAFLMESLASLQMCTCVYENGVILKNYGVIGFFFTVIGLLIAGGVVNRGAFVNPLPVLELAFKNVISIERASILLLAQLVGGGLAFRCAEYIWYLTMNMVDDHLFFYQNLPCAFHYKYSLTFAMVYEILGCFALRFIGSRLPVSSKGFLMPAMVSFLLSVAFVYVGVPALNPLTVSARMFNCKGLDQQTFFVVYWALPMFGWFVGALLDDYLSDQRPKGSNFAPKQKKQIVQEKKKWFSGKKKQH